MILCGKSVHEGKRLMLRVESPNTFFISFEYKYMCCSQGKMGANKIDNSCDTPVETDIFTALVLRNHTLHSQAAQDEMMKI